MSLVLIDTNVILDVFLDRDAESTGAAEVLGLVERRHVDGIVSSLTITTLWYLLEKHRSHREALARITSVVQIADITTVGSEEIEAALADVRSGTFRDFEDAVQHAAAEAAGADAIVTRNEADFRDARIVALTPFEFLSRL